MRNGFARRVLLPAWLAIIVAGCEVQPDTEALRRVLLETDRAFSDYSGEHGAAEAFREFMVEDALQLPAGALPIRGRDRVFDAMSDGGGGYTLLWEPKEGDVAASGELGYTWGIYTVTIQGESGEPILRKGKYLNIWRRDELGNWRVLIDMGNQNPAEE